MFFGSGGPGGPGHLEERPSRGKKIDVKISNKHFMVYFILFIMLFILMLVAITLVEMAAKSQQVALYESRGEHYRYREGTCQLRVWVCTEFQTSTGYEKECKYEWRKA